MNVDQGTVNFAVYEDSTEFYGMAEVTLPEISQMTEAIKGAGIAGELNAAYVGQFEAMTMSLNFNAVTKEVIRLQEPRNHHLEIRSAQQSRDNSSGRHVQTAIKHVLIVSPIKVSPGKVAVASPAEASGEFSVSYYATYIKGKKELEIDILNFIYFLNGVDYLAEVRKALGK